MVATRLLAWLLTVGVTVDWLLRPAAIAAAKRAIEREEEGAVHTS